MNSRLNSWLKSSVTALFFSAAYSVVARTSFPKPSRDKKTLFILGSGSSVDQLDEHHWNFIAGQTSIGINYWTVHEFQPTYFALENAPEDAVQALESLITSPSKARGSRVLWFGGPNRVNRRLLRNFCHLGGQLSFYPAWRLHDSTRLGLRSQVSGLFRAFRFLPRALRPAIDAGNTVSRLVTMAIVNGWETIVLLGVDLGGPYFEAYRNHAKTAEKYSGRRVPQGIGPDLVHRVDSAERGEMMLSRFLASLEICLRQKGRVSLLDGSVSKNKYLTLESFAWPVVNP